MGLTRRDDGGVEETITTIDEALEAARSRSCMLKWALSGVASFEGHPTTDQVETLSQAAGEIHILLKLAIGLRESERPA